MEARRIVSLRLIFMGTPDFSVPTLLALQASGHDIAAVYTREGGEKLAKLIPAVIEQLA